MSLYPFMGNIFSVLDSPQAAAMGSAFGIGAELEEMSAVLHDVQQRQSRLFPRYDIEGVYYSFYDPIWREFNEAVIDAEFLLDELSTELALHRELAGLGEMFSRKISIFFSRRNPLVYSRRLSSRIKRINDRVIAFTLRPPNSRGIAWPQKLLRYRLAAFAGPAPDFQHLSLHLKHCFGYCLLFPVNYAIDKSTIIQIWIAQGLVPASNADNKCMEEVGHEYFMDLCRDSMFTEIQEDEVGNIVTFKVNNFMYLLAEQFEECDYSQLSPHPGSIHLSSVECRYGKEAPVVHSMTTSGPRVRTFLMPYQPRLVNMIQDNGAVYEQLIQKEHCLRALDLHRACIKNVPSSVDKLKHLRYLDLSYNTRLEMLPRCITTLWNLQTLKLSYCERLKELPEDISKLVNLRHLEIDGCWGLAHMPSGIGRLKHLHVLSMFVVSEKSDESVSSKKAGLRELGDLHRLRGGLKLRGLENVRCPFLEVRAANMKEKQNLETFTLMWEASMGNDDAVQFVHDEAILEYLEPNQNLKGLCIHGYRGARFPGWLYSVHLVKITLNNCHQFRHLPPLDQLYWLKCLALEKLSALEYIIGNEPRNLFHRPQQAAYFPSLEQLCLKELPNLKGWFEEDKIRDTQKPLPNSLSVLSMVTIDNCPKLSMPLLPTVRSLHVNKTSKAQLQSFVQPSLPWLSHSHPDKYGATSFIQHANLKPGANLKSLYISYVKDLDHLSETYFSKLPYLEDLEIRHCPSLLDLPPLNSLKRITILGCQRLNSLSGWIDHHLTKIENLKLHGCPELDLTHYRSSYKEEDVDLRLWPEFELPMSRDAKEPKFGSSVYDRCAFWGSLRRLTSLEIVDIPRVVFLPEWLRLATSLQRLELIACSGLIELPKWISEFQSLNELVLSFCPILALLPQGLSDLIHLSKLKIIGCPLLKQMYNKETGSGWKDIAHVDDVEVR